MSTTVTTGTRTVRGFEIPVAGEWEIDPGHTQVEFVGRHMMLSKVRGRFNDVTGSIVLGEEPGESSVDITIATASVESGFEARDDHLRSQDFFDVKRFPTARFVSRHVEWRGHEATVHGELTLVGVTRPVTLEVSYAGTAPDTTGALRSIFSAWAELDREDWGLTWNAALETGGVLVGKRIRLEIETETVLRA